MGATLFPLVDSRKLLPNELSPWLEVFIRPETLIRGTWLEVLERARWAPAFPALPELSWTSYPPLMPWPELS